MYDNIEKREGSDRGSFFVWAVAIVCLVWSCTGSSSDGGYEKGYEDAWSGKKKESSWLSKANQEYQYGYEQGEIDAWMYNQGFYDAYHAKIAPQHKSDPYYMNGYKDGKR